MILQALTRYYEDLLTRGEIAAPGWSPAKISFALCLDENGTVIQVIPTMQEVVAGKKTVQRPQEMVLPAAVYAPSPTRTGATRLVLQPIKALSPMVQRFLCTPS